MRKCPGGPGRKRFVVRNPSMRARPVRASRQKHEVVLSNGTLNAGGIRIVQSDGWEMRPEARSSYTIDRITDAIYLSWSEIGLKARCDPLYLQVRLKIAIAFQEATGPRCQ